LPPYGQAYHHALTGCRMKQQKTGHDGLRYRMRVEALT